MSGAVEGVALLPCPFCGSLPRVWKGSPFFFREEWASCQGHDGSGSSDVGHPTIRMPLRHWNTRTTPPARSYADGDWVLVPREITQAMLDATCATDADDAAMRNTWSELIRTAASPSNAQTHGKWHVMLLGLVNAIHRDRGVKTQAIGIQASYDQALAAIRLLSQGGKA